MSIELGIASPISIMDIMSEVKSDIDMENSTKCDSDIFRLIVEATIGLDNAHTYIKRWQMFDVVDYRVKLPNGFVRLLSIEVPAGEKNSAIDPEFVYYYATDFKPNNAQMKDISYWNDLGQIVGEYFVFNTSYKGRKVCMTWEGYNVDEYCLIKVYREQVRAIRAYVKYQMASMRKYRYLFERGDSEKYGREWAAQKAYLGGEAFMTEAMNMRMQLKEMYTAQYVNPNESR